MGNKRFLMLSAVIWLALAAASAAPAAEEAPEETARTAEMVVTATRTAEELDRIPSTVFVVDRQDIEEKGIWRLPDALDSIPGLWVRGNGPFGGPTSFTMRGGQPGQTRLMLDGVRLADPIATGGEFNLSMLDTTAMERIEVVQGPQSTLYGSDAMAGVVNIITRRGRGTPGVWALGQGGSYNTWRGELGSQGEVDKFNYFVSASGLTTDGISSAKDAPEDDGYNNQQFNTRLGYQFNPDTEVYAVGYYHKAKVDYDSFWEAPLDTPESVKNTAWTGITGLNQGLTGWWDHKLKLSAGENKRDYSDDSVYNSRLLTADWQHDLKWGKISTTTLGADWEQERGDYDVPAYGSKLDAKDTDVMGLYLQEQLNPIKGLYLVAGARYDDHQDFGDKTTWRTGASYLIEPTGTRLRANYGTGFKAPTLYQLYSEYGDRDLQPETSKGWDAGVDQKIWGERVEVGVTYFSLETEDLIAWDYDTWKYKNVGESKSRGVEAALNVMVTGWLGFDASYTYTDAQDGETDQDLTYVPKNMAHFGVRLEPLTGLVGRVDVRYVGERYTDDANTNELDSYTLVNLAVSYRINQHLQVFGRLINLFDEDYEEIEGYGTEGFSGMGGFKVEF